MARIRASINAAAAATRVAVHAPEVGLKKCPSLTIAATEHQRSAATWELKVDALIGLPQVTTVRLGTLATVPPATTGRNSRVFGWANLPGAVGWILEVRRTAYSGIQADLASEEALLELELAVSEDQTDAGLQANEPHAELFGERWFYYAAALVTPGPTNVIIPANQRVHIVSCWQSGTGMTFSVDGGNNIPVPPDGSGVAQPLGRIRGALTVNFASIPAGGGGYLIECTN